MNLADLIRRFRVLAKDVAEPYRVENADVIDWLNDAQAQACVRGRLLVAESDPALCQIALAATKVSYPLHRSLYELIDLRIKPAAGAVRPVTIKSREWLEAELPGWRDDPRPCCIAVQTDTGLRMVGKVEDGETLHLEAYRLPLAPLAAPIAPDDPDAVWPAPEIHEAHHEHLIQWVLHKAFSVPDSQLFDLDRSMLAERAFTAYFGPLPDSDMRRQTREDVQHYIRGYLP
ncbi:hypothetical protein A4F85_04635 [Delftia sp. GW456-R20]|uniref:phage adaptor protein n=1 Tax=Delftia sp. GW456-R20 TaxID=1827145 RepID=UPI0007AEC218|nr:hypothetical protein [Delftia sp. GW456-R20]KZK32008.1 hypothetical protein A4F85_04635 [Delftia sp. GW456-R20]